MQSHPQALLRNSRHNPQSRPSQSVYYRLADVHINFCSIVENSSKPYYHLRYSVGMGSNADVADSQTPPERPPKGIPPDDNNDGARNHKSARNAERSPTRSLRHLPLHSDSIQQDNTQTVATSTDPDPISRRPVRQIYASEGKQYVTPSDIW